MEATSGAHRNTHLLDIDELRARLEEAEQTLNAIRSGDVDALVVYSDKGERVYTLSNADQPYRVFVENMKEGAVTLGDDGTILYCNQGFADMADVPLQRLMGRSIEGLLMPREGGAIMTLLSGLGDRGIRAEMTVVRPGAELAALVSVAKLETEGPASIALTVTDLSRQRDQENELKRANAELEGFCYSVSHDLRAPLRSIVGSAHVMMQDYASSMPPEVVSDLAHISKSANYLGRLIDDLLTYSRLARTDIHRQEIDLSRMAKEIVSDGLPLWNIRTEWKIQDGLTAIGDTRLVKLVLENLISNAAKYSCKESAPVVEFGSVKGPDGSRFYVKDNGIGFEMAYVDKIFLPFERLHRQVDYPGTGIGLANAKRIIGKHGGEIWAESEPGAGAKFYFTLPDSH